MSKRIVIPGFIVYRTEKFWHDHERFAFSMYDPRAAHTVDKTKVFVQEHALEVDVPEDFDPRPQMVAQLVAEKQRIQGEFAKRVTELDAQINSLLALEAA
jgi:hypothetical protein